MSELKKQTQRLLKMICIVVGFSMPIEMLFADPVNCNINPSAISGIISYDTSGTTNTYCELCGIGQVRIVVENPTNQDMADFVIQHVFNSDELEYVPGSTNGGADGDPSIATDTPVIGATTLTWTQAQIAALTQINGTNNHPHNFVEIIFQVRSTSGDEENLVNIDRGIQATADFDFCPLDNTNLDGSVSTSTTLPINEPIPIVTKRGRNVDAEQTNWTQTVYGNINDDVIWRIQIQNNSSTALQDLKFDDLMLGGNFLIEYACPNFNDADDIAAADGGGPVGACVNSSNTITPFIVDGDFGSQASVAEDVPANSSIFIYLVGKILNSCDPDTTNTVENIEWGCEVIPADGGITHTSLTLTPIADATATLSSFSDANDLDVVPVLTGITDTNVGSRGLMTITVTNDTGGTVRDIVIKNELPAEYVVDSTFTPTLTMQNTSTTLGDYDGRVDGMTVAMDDGIGNILAAPPADPLDYKIPVFTLTSSDTHSVYTADQRHMLRHGDEAVIRFRVVMIKADHFDNKANIDVAPETPAVADDTSDPVNYHSALLPSNDPLTNTLNVDYKNFCDLSTTQSQPELLSEFNFFPEDLDIEIPGSALTAFILTNNQSQTLPLSVLVSNNGGHTADDYYVYITFGTTMEVEPTSVPTGCSLTSNPPLLEVWEDPADIPKGASLATDAAVYVCDSRASPNGLGPITPGGTRTLDFLVRKTTDADRLDEDDLTFRADVIGEVRLSDNTLTGSGALLTFPTVVTTPIVNRANNYSLDSVRAKVIGFNLTKTQPIALSNSYYCSENNSPLPVTSNEFVEIGEECRFHIETGGWFGFETPGYTYIAVQRIQVDDVLPNGQGFISTDVPAAPILPSDGEILGVSFLPPPSPLDEGTFSWTFNQATPITVKDRWFRMDATTRILNNLSLPNIQAAQSSNVLVSTFDALFTSTISGPETITLDSNTIGYPRVVDRTVDLTITEPNILVTKEVCNETLSVGKGAACTPFATVITNGDTQDTYVYRITLENELDDNGSPDTRRAPAYNVVVTDTLDASDLMLVYPFDNANASDLVTPFQGDGLDNDGDGADENGVDDGSISENVLTPLAPAPAVLTFSHTHSTALQKIIPGDTVQLYYKVNPDDQIAPLQQLVNTVAITYDSLEGDSGNQTTPAPLVASNNGEVGGARVYNSTPTTATVQILPLQTQPKEITRLSNTTIGGVPQPVSIGEEIEYQLRTSIPVANLRSFKIRDELPTGISCIEAPVVNLNSDGPHADAGFVPGGLITPTCTNNLVEWDFGNQELTDASGNTLFDFKILFIARVNNSAGVDNTDVISNGDPTTNVVMSYINDASALVTQTFNEFSVVVQEPNIVLTKTYEAGNHDSGNIITVTVTAQNTGTAAAYNLKILDDLDAVDNLTFLNNVGGTDPPDNVTSYLGNTNRPIFSWNPDPLANYAKYSIAPGDTKTFTFEISVDLPTQPLEVLDNTIQASWQSLPGQSTALNTTGLIGADGSATGMRNGAIPNVGDAVNDYETTATTSSTVPAITVTKTDLNPASTPGDLAEVGVHKNYEIVISLPEGTTNNLVVNDNLNFSDISYVLTRSGIYDITYTFDGISTINNGLAPSEDNLISPAPIDGASGTITWNFGKVVTTTEDDTTGVPVISPSITINYYARVDNSITTNSGDRLQNQVTTNYTNGENAATEALINTTQRLDVSESVLAVTKVATAITAGPITSGHIIEYVITIPNSGNATAYDLNIKDTLPANFSLDLTFPPTAIINGSSVSGFVSAPAGSPNGPLIWGKGNGDNSLDIPAVFANPLILTYRVVVGLGAESNINYINSVLVDWTSLNGASNYERTGAGCPTTTAPNDYCIGPITSTIQTADTNSFTKVIVSDSYLPANDATVRIGDDITYRLSLNLQEGTTRNVNVQDVLPVGLSFVKIISINGDTVANYDSPASGTGSNFSYATITATSLPALSATGTINFSLGNVINDPLGDSTTDTLIIEYQVRVLNDTIPQTPTTTTLTNTATLQFIDGNGTAIIDPARLESSATLTVLQPELIVTKTEGAALVQIGTPISYSINVLNTGDSPAYDVTVTDVLPTFDPAAGGMCDNTPTNITVGIYDNIGPTLITALALGTDYIVNYSGCTLTLTMQSTTALAPDNNLIITYDALLDVDTPHTSILTNVAGATQWFSQDAASATSEIQTYAKTLTDGTVGTADHEDGSTVTSDTPTVTVEKQVYNVTTSQSGATATPGDLLRYSITIINTSSVELFDYSFTDELDALNAGAWFAANTLNLTTIPAGADVTFTDAAGGARSTGLVDIRNLTLGITPSDNTVLIEFEVNLAPSIPDGTTVLNQGIMTTNALDFLSDDDLSAGGIESTKTLISSAPLFKIEKISTDLTGDPNILLSGDTLRYTIKVKNIGTEDTINSILRDQLPANTTYITGSTTLNGNVITEPIPGTLPLQAGILIKTPVNATAGEMIADGSGTDLTIGAYASIVFDVTINNNVVNGTIISNQGYVSADGIASGAMADTPSDDPSTPTVPNDPTRDVVGNQPLLDAHKTVSIVDDQGTTGVLDPDDTIRYTITITNTGATPATDVRFIDGVDIGGVTFINGAPTGTDYVANSVTLNGLPIADVGGSPLVAGISVSSTDLTPPIPTTNGIISAGGSAVITFDVKVNNLTAIGYVISNQGKVYSNELPIELTDADGVDSNGDQPTLIIVGNQQLVTITKSVAVVGGGPALAGGQLEYRVLVTNISSVPATNVVIYDDLDVNVPAPILAIPEKYLTYVANSGLLDGLATGVSFADPVIKADYYTAYGNLLPGQSTELVFRAQINNDIVIVPIGTTITNTAYVNYDVLPETAAASVSVDIGGTPGVANVNGSIWHNSNLDNLFDNNELGLSGWNVDIYRDTTLLGTVLTDTDGNYQINGLLPNYLVGDPLYELRFRAPGSTPTTAKLGIADSQGVFSDALHRIYNIVLNSGSNTLGLNLPVEPNGVVYNSVERVSIAGATISLLNAGTGIELSSNCFDDVNQQNQITTANGYYKFDLNFSQGDCAPGGNYLIRITAPATGYSLLPSVAILPQTDATTTALDVPGCPGSGTDAIPATVTICEAQTSEFNPAFSVPPVGSGTYYYLHLTLDNGTIPEDSQLFNNHLPIDPVLNNAVSISKVTPMVNVTRSQLIPYTITVRNKLTFPLANTNVVDTFPAGFKYVKGSARLNGISLEPIQNGLQVTWSNIDLIPDEVLTFKLLLIVGAAVHEDEYINRAHVFDTLTQSLASGIATATVRVVPDPTFDCSDVIGKVFDDKNLNGYQDEGEKGIAGTRVVTARGLNVTSDKYGRFHLTCAVVPDESRGSNFIIKLDERSLPSGYRVTTENPRVQRATRGKMLKFNFGAAIHRVVSMDMADGVFEKDSNEIHSQWLHRIDLLIEQLKDKPSILRLSYLADIEDSGLVDDRLESMQEAILEKWGSIDSYELTIETEIFWRRGGPPDFGDID